MASKTTLNVKNLEALGSERLAQLLFEISTGDANAKRRLRMELAGAESPGKLVHEIRKRLSSIGGTTTFIGWRSLKGFRTDLNVQRQLIVEQVAKAEAADGLDLMWQFIGLSTGVLERTTDTSGEVIGIFRQACEDIGAIAEAARIDGVALADKAAEAVLGNVYGQCDRLVMVLATALGEAGLIRLRERILAGADGPETRSALRGRKTSRWRRGRKLERDVERRRARRQIVQMALSEIADALGDVDAYIALQGDRQAPEVAAHIAERLVGAGRAEEALAILDEVRTGPKAEHPVGLDNARMAALEAVGRGDEAQALRLAGFHRSLNGAWLRAYIKRLPDFDDIEAEDAALDLAMGYRDVDAALAFLVDWPALDRAAQLVLKRAGEIDGDEDKVLAPVAEKLEAKYPLAASVLLRRMIDTVLNNSRSIDYGRAAEQLREAARLSAQINDFGMAENHEAYFGRLRAAHGRKAAFWNAVGED